MQQFNYPEKDQWADLLQRPAAKDSGLQQKVATMLQAVKMEGDQAVRNYTREFDGVDLHQLEIPREQWLQSSSQLTPALKAAIDNAIANIRRFHEAQKEPVTLIETQPGIQCWRKSVGIERVGLYIPGGTAPLFSTLLMLAVPAVLAGCKEIIVCTPAGKDGLVHPAILYAATQAGAHRLFAVGGVQAIGAMAYGTERIPQVYKIFGPGNAYVTAAKMQLQAAGIAIDLPAGPSEVAVLADDTAIPAYVAADLLSQAEHGADSQVVLVSNSAAMLSAIQKEVARQLEDLPRKDLAAQALVHSRAILVHHLEEGMELLNTYAPEHLIIACEHAEALAELVINAGSVFLGNYSPESAGDYASGTNHTLPTNGYAKAYSGVSLDSFVRKITFQQLSREGLAVIGNTITEMARAEGLEAHARAVTIRTNNL